MVAERDNPAFRGRNPLFFILKSLRFLNTTTNTPVNRLEISVKRSLRDEVVVPLTVERICTNRSF